MDYLSTKELAEKWQVSESRIVRLAKAGRISGAKLVGKSWLFPADTEKPGDGRRKENKAAEPEPFFRFPFYLYSVYSKAEIEKDFTGEEAKLYQAEALFFGGDYQKCYDILADLLKSTNDRYVRFGALYYICLTRVYLRHFGRAFSAYNEIRALYLSETVHKTEIGFIIRNLEAYFVGNEPYIEDFSIDMQTVYPPHMREFLLLECAYSDMLRAQYKAAPISAQTYEVLLQTDRARFSPLSLLTMHLYVGSLCRTNGQVERSVYHIRESCRIAKEHDLEYSSVAFMSKYLQTTYESALGKQDPAQLDRLKAISDDMFDAFRELFGFAGRNSMLHALNPTDCALISFAVKGMTNKEIAQNLHLASNTVSKKYSQLLLKTGTHSKKELVDRYLQSIWEY